jgi:hypothetical protein
MIAEFTARRVQSRILVFLAFDRARLASSGAMGDQIGGQSFQQLVPELLAFLLGAGLTPELLT